MNDYKIEFEIEGKDSKKIIFIFLPNTDLDIIDHKIKIKIQHF